MKKLLTFMIMLGVFLIPRYTTHAYTINSLDDIAYGGLTYREIFIDGQLISNSDFTNGTTGWNAVNSTLTVTEFILSITATNNSPRMLIQIGPVAIETSQKIYMRTKSRVTNNVAITMDMYISATSGTVPGGINTPTQNRWYEYSNFNTISDTDGAIQFFIRHTYSSDAVANGKVMEIEYAFAYNLTLLFGAGNEPNQSIMDDLFKEYQNILIFIEAYNEGILASDAYSQGFNTGYDLGYGDGYQDAVEEDNAYALGYAKGLSEGADMETGSSIIVFVVGAIGFIMMIFGFTTKRRIFNLLSVGAFIVLGGLLAQYVGFIIITIGLVIVNVYYTFWGEI